VVPEVVASGIELADYVISSFECRGIFMEKWEFIQINVETLLLLEKKRLEMGLETYDEALHQLASRKNTQET